MSRLTKPEIRQHMIHLMAMEMQINGETLLESE
jgi:hypothetical protein